MVCNVFLAKLCLEERETHMENNIKIILKYAVKYWTRFDWYRNIVGWQTFVCKMTSFLVSYKQALFHQLNNHKLFQDYRGVYLIILTKFEMCHVCFAICLALFIFALSAVEIT